MADILAKDTVISLEETKEEKEFIIDSNKIALTSIEYLNELDARISNLEKIFNISVKINIKQ